MVVDDLAHIMDNNDNAIVRIMMMMTDRLMD